MQEKAIAHPTEDELMHPAIEQWAHRRKRLDRICDSGMWRGDEDGKLPARAAKKTHQSSVEIHARAAEVNHPRRAAQDAGNFCVI